MTIIEIAFIKSPESWPNWPYLPLVRGKEKGFAHWELGVIRADDPTRVYLCNVMEARNITHETPHIQYESAEALVADSWRVD